HTDFRFAQISASAEVFFGQTIQSVRPLRMPRARAGSSRPNAAADFTNARITPPLRAPASGTAPPGGSGASFAWNPSGAWSRTTTEFSRMGSFLGRGAHDSTIRLRTYVHSKNHTVSKAAAIRGYTPGTEGQHLLGMGDPDFCRKRPVEFRLSESHLLLAKECDKRYVI